MKFILPLTATLVLLLAFAAPTPSAPAAFELQLVSAGGPPFNTVLTSTATFNQRRLRQSSKLNLYYPVGLAIQCDNYNPVTTTFAWSSPIFSSITGGYVGTVCRAWLWSLSGGKDDENRPASNIVSFSG